VSQLTREGRNAAARLLENERMTINDAINGGTSADELDNPGEHVEELPREVKEDVRHLAHGASPMTLCGLDRAAVSTAHPSKARKTDCQACKDVLRGARVEAKATKERPEALTAGARVEFADGSAWLVEDVRPSGVDVRCLLGGKEYARGRKLTVSANSPLRVFLPGEFEALVEESKRAAETMKVDPPKGLAGEAPKAREPKTPAWKPTEGEIVEVRRLRALGLSYIAIEATIGWPDGHGNRPWRICNGAYDK
jgi:hypothetical protein